MKIKPRGKTPSLIGGANGKPSKSTAQRKCECSRCHDDILANTTCFDIPKTGGGFSRKKRFCIDCYTKIMEQSEADVTGLRTELDECIVDSKG